MFSILRDVHLPYYIEILPDTVVRTPARKDFMLP